MEVTRKPHLHRDWIDSHAFGIVKALQKGGFTTYLVGGCVRDLLLGVHPKDYDIATMAHPPQVKRLIYMSFIIGRRFRLVLVKRDDQQFEVATFRKEIKTEDIPIEGDQPFGDNVFGTPEEDAVRRDFTVNGLFYDPVNDQLIDFVGGVSDIEKRVLRMIGDPETRLIEDSIRILRGLRLSHKLGLTIEPVLRAAMEKHASSLKAAVLPRRREEVLKMLRLDQPELALLEAHDLGILSQILPTLDHFLQDPSRREKFLDHFISYRSVVTNPADPAQLFAWLLYSLLQAALDSPTERETELTIEDEIFQNFMRDELGMFKLEQTTVIQAIELMKSLPKIDDFRRRGERRQSSFMKNEGFTLALQLAAADYLISPAQIEFWRSGFEKMRDEMGDEAFDEGARPPKRRARRPRRRRDGAAATGGGDDKPATDEESSDKINRTLP